MLDEQALWNTPNQSISEIDFLCLFKDLDLLEFSEDGILLHKAGEVFGVSEKHKVELINPAAYSRVVVHNHSEVLLGGS